MTTELLPTTEPLALKSNLVLGAWAPIATAPKDGTRILVCGGSVSEPKIARRWEDGEVTCELYEDRRLQGDAPDTPTYWMPLPAKPQVTSDAPNVRAKRAATAGRQARAGENVWRAARLGLVACRWRSA